MKIQFFDVEHGACALLTCDNGSTILFDCGHNSSTGWRPGTYLREQGISSINMLAITNYDEDHASGADSLFDNVDVKSIWRNKSVSTAALKMLKTEDGMGSGIERVCKEIDNTFTGGPTDYSVFNPFAELQERICFYNDYPKFYDENNLSMAVFIKCHGVGIMFTGDMEKDGFKELLNTRGDFRQALQSTQVYVASHHGRENGCSDKVAQLLSNVSYVIISDKGYAHDTQRTIPFYRAIAKVGPFRGETRYVLTTRNDGRIGFTFNPKTWGPY